MQIGTNEYCWSHDPGGWDCIACNLITFFEDIGAIAQTTQETEENAISDILNINDPTPFLQEGVMEIRGGETYLTRDGTRASVWHWGKNMLGEECWVGTVQGGGLNCWNSDGQDLSGTTEWDIVAPIPKKQEGPSDHPTRDKRS